MARIALYKEHIEMTITFCQKFLSYSSAVMCEQRTAKTVSNGESVAGTSDCRTWS